MHTAENYQSGNIRHFVDNWFKVTRDPWVLGMVQGVRIPLVTEPIQEREPFPFRMTPEETDIMSGEIEKLIGKGVVEQVDPVEGQFVSNVFLRPKPDGQHRLILDLTQFNKNVQYEHFKMATLQTALNMVRPGCFMASIDLKDAYYSVPVAREHRKYLRFKWGN